MSFRNLTLFAEHRFGEEGARRLLESLSEDDRRELAGIIPIGWYDLDLYQRLLHALVRVHGDGDLLLAEQYGRFAAEQDLTTIHKLLMRAVNPGLLLEQSMKLWNRFHDTGLWKVERTGGAAKGTLSDWGCADATMCREILGYLEYMLSLGLGGKRAHVEHPACRAQRAPACVFVCVWR